MDTSTEAIAGRGMSPIEADGPVMGDAPGHVVAQPPLDAKDLSRRKLLMQLGLALNGLVVLAIATPVVRYLLFPLKKKDGYLSWVSLGSVNDFPEGDTRLVKYRNPYTHPWDGETGNVAAYVRREQGNTFTVFAINCAHLGCPVRWFDQSQLFMCPCHGGVYYEDGRVAAGPPPHPLTRYPVRITGDQVEIRTDPIPIG
jgi:Rieske Fe-S protein